MLPKDRQHLMYNVHVRYLGTPDGREQRDSKLTNHTKCVNYLLWL